MGLFDKKYCDICGEKIGLLGNRKLDDGNLCKNCAARLSPWFSERRQSTVAQIREQLEYREANKEKVAAFHTTRSMGRSVKILLDEDAMKFMVTSARNLAEANPDVVDFSAVTGVDLDVNENRMEEMQTERMRDGSTRRVPFNPPRYTTHYDFNLIIRVNHEYFDDMSFRLNDSSVTIHTTGAPTANRGGFGGGPGFGGPGGTGGFGGPAGRGGAGGASMKKGFGGPGASNMKNPGGANMKKGFGAPAAPAGRGGFGGPAGRGGFGGPGMDMGFGGSFSQGSYAGSDNTDPMTNPDYAEYYNMGMEIKEILMYSRNEARENMAAANAPKQAVRCACCGATSIPDANGCCEYCGSPLA